MMMPAERAAADETPGVVVTKQHGTPHPNRRSHVSPMRMIRTTDEPAWFEDGHGGPIVSSPLPMLVVSLPDQRIRTANASAGVLLGLTHAELTKRHAKDLVQPSESADTSQALSALSSGALDSYHAHRTLAGAHGPVDAWVWVRSIPRNNGGMALLLFLPAPHDEPFDLETRALMGPLAVDLASGTLDGSGVIVTLQRTNPEVLHSPRARSGSSRHLVSYVHPDDQSLLFAAFTRLRKDDHDVMVALRVRHAHRGWIAGDCHLFATGDDDHGQPVGFVIAEGSLRVPGAGRVAQLELHLGRIVAEAEAAGLTPRRPSSPTDRPPVDLDALTPRQREIVERLLDGSRVPSIATALFVSRSTVRNHLAGVYRIFDVHSQAQLIELLRPA
jgi:DNA-binding CsgD family transcriptional regulator